MSRSRRSVLAVVLTLVLAVFVGAAGAQDVKYWREDSTVTPAPELVALQRAAGRPRRQAQAGAGARAGPAGRRAGRRGDEPGRAPAQQRLRLSHRPQRPDRDQRPRRRRRRLAASAAVRWPSVQRQGDRPGRSGGPGARADRGRDQPADPAARRLQPSARRRVRHGARPSVRARAIGVLRDREPQGRAAHGGRARLRLHPDRCRDQSRQLRRPARQHGRAGRGRQQHGGAQRLHRLRDPVQPGEAAGAAARATRARSSGDGSACRSPRSATTIWAG